jgi:hypothetical protein
MKNSKYNILTIMIIISTFVFGVAVLILLFGDYMEKAFNVIGIRVATLFVAFASFCSSSVFSLLIFKHNRTISQANEDANKRAELFREVQFASNNYSIIEFMDRLLIYDESIRYVEKYIMQQSFNFHMLEERVEEENVLKNPQSFTYISLKIPFRIVEGKIVSAISFNKLRFMRDGVSYTFFPPQGIDGSPAYILHNETTKRNNVIINLIVPKDSDFFVSSKINDFSKIEIDIEILSILGVKVKGVSELFFTNPLQIEGNASNTYRINSSTFTITETPKVLILD